MGEVRELSPEASDTFKTDVSAAIKVLLPQQDLSQVSLGEFRASLADHLGLQHAVLEERKDEVNAWVRAEVQKPAATPEQHMACIVEELGAEVTNFKHQVHLLTISRVLPGTLDCTDLRDIGAMTREEVADCAGLLSTSPSTLLAQGASVQAAPKAWCRSWWSSKKPTQMAANISTLL